MVQQIARVTTKPDPFSFNNHNNNGVTPMGLDMLKTVMTESNAIKQQMSHFGKYKDKTPRDNNITCFFCKKPGHIKRYCKKRIAAIKELDRNQQDSHNM